MANSSTGASGQSGAGATGASSGGRRGRAASTIPIWGGTREVKAYPVTEDELGTLGVIQGGSSFFLALAGGCLGFWINVGQQIDFADKQRDALAIAHWQAIQGASKWIGMGFAVIGMLLFLYNGWRVRRIKKSTIHA